MFKQLTHLAILSASIMLSTSANALLIGTDADAKVRAGSNADTNLWLRPKPDNKPEWTGIINVLHQVRSDLAHAACCK